MVSTSTRIPRFEIRPTTEDDVPLILSFIKDLADYEHLSHEVLVTQDVLRAALFGKLPTAEVVIGGYDANPVAFALYYYTFSSFLGQRSLFVEDLYVRPAHRGKGLGRELLVYLARVARNRNCGRLEWSVLDWNEPAIKFYKGIGAVPRNEWTIYQLHGEALGKLADETA